MGRYVGWCVGKSNRFTYINFSRNSTKPCNRSRRQCNSNIPGFGLDRSATQVSCLEFNIERPQRIVINHGILNIGWIGGSSSKFPFPAGRSIGRFIGKLNWIMNINICLISTERGNRCRCQSNSNVTGFSHRRCSSLISNLKCHVENSNRIVNNGRILFCWSSGCSFLEGPVPGCRCICRFIGEYYRFTCINRGGRSTECSNRSRRQGNRDITGFCFGWWTSIIGCLKGNVKSSCRSINHFWVLLSRCCRCSSLKSPVPWGRRIGGFIDKSYCIVNNNGSRRTAEGSHRWIDYYWIQIAFP